MESITQWDPSRVHQWMCTIGFSNLERPIMENGISGDMLMQLDHAALKDMSIWEVGKRLQILKAIYQLKVSYGISIEPGDYIPPSVAFENEYSYQAATSLKHVEQALHEKDDTIQHLVREVERMSKDMSRLKDELWNIQKHQKPLPEPVGSSGYQKGGAQDNMINNFNFPLSLHSPLTPLHQSPNSPLNPARAPTYIPETVYTPSTSHRNDANNDHSTGSTLVNPASPSSSNGFGSSLMISNANGFASSSANNTGASNSSVTNISNNNSTRARTPNHDAFEDGARSNSPGVEGAGAIKVYGRKAVATSLNPSSAGASSSTTSLPSSGSSSTRERGERDPVDAFKSFRITQDDPCYKVLPAALKKYKINDDWRQYALFICVGNTERILTYNEKPLLLMKEFKEKSKDSKETPVFMLKHIKQMKSPAANNAGSAMMNNPPRKSSDILNKDLPLPPAVAAKSPTTSSPASSPTSVGSFAGSTLTVSGSSLIPAMSSNTSSSRVGTPTQFGAGSSSSNGNGAAKTNKAASIRSLKDHDTGALSPTKDTKGADGLNGSTSQSNNTVGGGSSSISDNAASAASGATSPTTTTTSTVATIGENRVQETVEASGTAVALYEWEAKRSDELNVKVGDVFKIKSKGHGWWIVQRDEEVGWIPASILSENDSEDGYFSAEGVAIFDFERTSPNELSIKTGDKLKIFRRHQHWLLAMSDGQRGWVPSWFVNFSTEQGK